MALDQLQLMGALGGLGGSPKIFDPRAISEYERAARLPEDVAAWCGDYWFADRDDLEHDRVDLGRTLDIPALVLWDSSGIVGARCDPLQIWQKHFPGSTGRALSAGHFLPEECPRQVLAAFTGHLVSSPQS